MARHCQVLLHTNAGGQIASTCMRADATTMLPLVSTSVFADGLSSRPSLCALYADALKGTCEASRDAGDARAGQPLAAPLAAAPLADASIPRASSSTSPATASIPDNSKPVATAPSALSQDAPLAAGGYASPDTRSDAAAGGYGSRDRSVDAVGPTADEPSLTPGSVSFIPAPGMANAFAPQPAAAPAADAVEPTDQPRNGQGRLRSDSPKSATTKGMPGESDTSATDEARATHTPRSVTARPDGTGGRAGANGVREDNTGSDVGDSSQQGSSSKGSGYGAADTQSSRASPAGAPLLPVQHAPGVLIPHEIVFLL